MSTSDKNDIEAQEIPLDQLSEVAGGVVRIPERPGKDQKDPKRPRTGGGARPL